VTDTLHVRPQTTVGARVRRSFDQSVGSIVFGMEDGTVSIFGLVFGVAASAPDSKAVLLAGANDQNAAKLEDLRRRLDHESSMKDEAARAP
jgi:hypothetical protein